jgi:hypothetical protein
MKRNLKKAHFTCVVLIGLLALAVPATPQESEGAAEKKQLVRIIGTGGLGVATLKASAADKIRTGSGGLFLELGGGLQFFNSFDIGIGVAAQFLKDNDKFTNSTTGGDLSSSVWPLLYYAQAGLQAPIPFRNKNRDFPVWLAFHIGTLGVSVDRSIGNCVGCDREKLSLKGGTFYRPEVRLQVKPGLHIGLGYTIFCDCADYKSMIAVTFSGSFRD